MLLFSAFYFILVKARITNMLVHLFSVMRQPQKCIYVYYCQAKYRRKNYTPISAIRLFIKKLNLKTPLRKQQKTPLQFQIESGGIEWDW